METPPRDVLFGADYYPEQWDRALWESDAQRMKAMGLDAVRLMEFAWALLEPEPGRYDFSLFDAAIDLLARYGLKVVLGTPTATFPVWLYEQDPSITQTHPSGIRRDFGTRRQGCYNAPAYRAASRRIVQAVAQHYGQHPAVIGWQVDNEIGHEGSDLCVCAHCRAAWAEWLARRYGSIARLNEAWGTVFWGTTYARFDQIPQPRPQVWSIQNPSLYLDYYRFMSDAAVTYIREQAEILRQAIAPRQWITTNLYNPPHGNVIDMRALLAPLDCVGFNNYPVWGDQDEPFPYYFISYLIAYMRGLREEERFSVFEQICGFQGHRCLGYLPPEEQLAAWTNQVIAHGAERVFYFRWRTARFGQEQLCYGLLDPDSADTRRYQVLGQNIAAHRADFRRIMAAHREPQACLLYDKDNARLLREQYLSQGLNHPAEFVQAGYDLEMARAFAPLVLFGVDADVKSTAVLKDAAFPLERYRLLSLPLYEIAEPDVVARLAEWVRAGGVLVLGWRAGARDERNQAVTTLLPGPFAEMAGLHVRCFESLNRTQVGVRLGLLPVRGEVWADVLSPTTARVLARYHERRKPYHGAPAITENRYGKGKVYYVGTSLAPLGLLAFYWRVLRQAQVTFAFRGMGLETIRRRTAEGAALEIVINHAGGARWLLRNWRLHRLAPYQMRVFDRG